jgi:hypothetical protein
MARPIAALLTKNQSGLDAAAAPAAGNILRIVFSPFARASPGAFPELRLGSFALASSALSSTEW